MVQKVLELQCKCNNYPWGKRGSASLAARLCAQTPGTGFAIEEEEAYAEMWMGTYPTLPSYVLSTGEDLQDVLDKHADELVGRDVIRKFGHTKLPYLPKVLSIAKALPLQLHPNKSLAATLHAKNPDQFTDPNHKPEIALALSKFEAFVGFKPLGTISALLSLEPLQQFRPGIKKPEFDDQALKHVVTTMLKAQPHVVRSVLKALKNLPDSAFGEETHIKGLIPRLAEQYSDEDNGSIVALVTMNYLTLSPGEALYIPADGIHAYLSGDIIECMARSNNVLNTGFCPRADRDSVDLFAGCLTFTPHEPAEAMLEPKQFEKGSGKSVVYAPPLSEFSLFATTLSTEESEKVQELGGPSVAVVTEGKGVLKAEGNEFEMREGFVYFIGQGVAVEFAAKEGLKVFTAFVE